MTTLDRFLTAVDLDELLRVRNEISSFTSAESTRVASVLRAWNDRQAVANLLFHPALIPVDIRFEALDRALQLKDLPYFTLAATVGLQHMSLDEVPADKRAAWGQALLAFVQSKSTVLAGRASVTLCAWSRSVATSEILPKLVSLYPVPDSGACRNIVAAVLETAETPPQRSSTSGFRSGVSQSPRAALRRAHDDYTQQKGHEALRAMITKAPGLAYIPNLSEGLIQRAVCDCRNRPGDGTGPLAAIW